MKERTDGGREGWMDGGTDGRTDICIRVNACKCCVCVYIYVCSASLFSINRIGNF